MWRHTKANSANPAATGLDVRDFELYLRIVALIQATGCAPDVAAGQATARSPAGSSTCPAPKLRGLLGPGQHGTQPPSAPSRPADDSWAPAPPASAPPPHPTGDPLHPRRPPALDLRTPGSTPAGDGPPSPRSPARPPPASGPRGPGDLGAPGPATPGSASGLLDRRSVARDPGAPPAGAPDRAVFVKERVPAEPYSPNFPAHALLRPPFSERVARATTEAHKREAVVSSLAAVEGFVVVGTSGARTVSVFHGLDHPDGATQPGPSVPAPAVSDPDAAPCAEVPLPDPVLCLAADPRHGVVWMGHEGGSVSCWAPDPSGGTLRPARVWKAFSGVGVGSVCAVDAEGSRLLTGSTWGEIRMWDAGPGGQPLHLTPHGGPYEPPPRCLDLRLAYGEQPHDMVRAMAVSAGSGVVWSGGKHNLALWDGRGGAFLGSISQADPPPPHGIDVALGLPTDALGRAVVEQSPGFLVAESRQQDRLGDLKVARAKVVGLGKRLVKKAGEALRKADGGGAGPGPARGGYGGATPKYQLGKLAAIEAVGSERVWAGYESGVVQILTGTGQLVGAGGVLCPGLTVMRQVGGNVWVGHAGGAVRVLGPSGAGLMSFTAHGSPVRGICQVGPLGLTAAADGSLASWPALLGSETLPGDDRPLGDALAAPLDLMGLGDALPARPAGGDGPPAPALARLQASWEDAVRGGCLGETEVRFLVGTWNVAEKRPGAGDVSAWLGERSRDADVAVVALQETQMGGGAVALSTAREVLGGKGGEQGNLVAQEWSAAAHAALDRDARGPWTRVALRQMGGIVVVVFARRPVLPLLGRVDTGALGVGVMGVGANKGAVAVRFELLRRTVCCVCSHLSAHQGAWDRRNQDFASVMSGLRFGRVLGIGAGCPTAQSALAAAHHAEVGAGAGDPPEPEDPGAPATPSSLGGQGPAGAAAAAPGQGIADSDVVLWAGDLNYRVDVPYDDAVRLVASGDLGQLLSSDQLRTQMAAGAAFQGFEEAPLRFPPTYKFDKGDPSPAAYDSSEKRRVPAWTDRVLWLRHAADEAIEVRVSCEAYESVPEVTTSDHKPVVGTLSVRLPHVDLRRQAAAFAAATRGLWADAAAPPDVALAPAALELGAAPEERVLELANRGELPLTFSVELVGGGGGAGPADWLEACPVAGALGAGDAALVTVGYRGPGGGAPRDCRLRVVVRGVYASGLPEATHARVLEVPVSEARAGPGGVLGPGPPPPAYGDVVGPPGGAGGDLLQL